MSGDASDPIQDEWPWLYQLSLALGGALDLGANCRGFLRALVTRPGLTGAAIWWCTAEGDGGEGLALLDAWLCSEAPAAVLPLTHPVWRLSRGGEPLVLSPGESSPGPWARDTERGDRGHCPVPFGSRWGPAPALLGAGSVHPPMLARLGAMVGNLAAGDPGRAGPGAPGVLRGRAAAERVPVPRPGRRRHCADWDLGHRTVVQLRRPRKEAELAPAESEIPPAPHPGEHPQCGGAVV